MTRPLKVLDIFAGSGCIGIAVLKHLPNTTVDFVDSEDNCLEQIKINCEINKIDPKRYRVIKGDVFDGGDLGKYDLILANPPYCVRPNVDISVLTYEPVTAVIGGGDFSPKRQNTFVKMDKFIWNSTIFKRKR